LIWAGIVASGSFATKDGVTYWIFVSAKDGNRGQMVEFGEHLWAQTAMTIRNGSRYHAAGLLLEIILNLPAQDSSMEELAL
jgi:hypothetical protein